MNRKPAGETLQQEAVAMRKTVCRTDYIQYFKKLFKNLTDGIMLCDKNGKHVHVNSALSGLLGYSQKEFLSMNPSDIAYPEDADLQSDIVTQLKNGKIDNFSVEKRYLHKKGHIVWGDTVVLAVRDTHGILKFTIVLIKDITDRKKSENRIQESDSRLRTLISSVPVGIFQADEHGNSIYVNQAICKYTGLSSINHDGLKWKTAIHPDDQAHVQKLWKKYISGQGSFETEFRFIRKDGQITWVSSTSSTIRNKDGKACGFIGTLTDITQKKQSILRAEQLNHLNEELLSLTGLNEKLKLITDAVIRVFHADFARIWIIKPGDLCDTDCPHAAVTVEPHICHYRDRCLHLLASSGRYTHLNGDHRRVPFGCYKIGRIAAEKESKFITNAAARDPRVHNHEWAKKLGLTSFAGYRLLSEDKKVIGVLALFSKKMILPDTEKYLEGIATKTSHVIQAETAKQDRKESEKKYRSMMESILDPVMICSSDLKVTYMNPVMIERIGKDATGEICHKAIHNLDSKCDWCLFDTPQLKNRNEQTIVSPLDDRTYRITAMPINNKDGSVEKMTIFKDITDYLSAVSETEMLQRKLLQSQKMAAIGVLAGGIAHDFNNILYPVIGFAEMSIQDLPPDHPVKENLEDILHGAKRARDLVKQILQFSRQKETEQEPVLLQPIIKEAGKLLRASIPSNIDLKENLYTAKDYVVANSTEIHEVVMNLCTNAYHSMEDTGGTLTIDLRRADQISIINLPGNDYCCLSVTDTGMGISPKIINDIFDPYFTTKDQGKGSGLGLSVIHGIVKNLKGEITVESEPGKGSVFKVFLPITSKTGQTDKKDAGTKLPTGDENILFVDDEESIVKLGKLILEKLGYSVTARQNSVDALALFKSDPEKFDLIITDMSMPSMVGTEFAKKIMEIRSDIPIMICTGFSENIDQKTACALGIKGYINKPILLNELATETRKLIDQNRKDKKCQRY